MIIKVRESISLGRNGDGGIGELLHVHTIIGWAGEDPEVGSQGY